MTYNETAAHGTKIQLGDGATVETFSDINGVHNGPNGPGFMPRIIEAFHHGTTVVKKRATVVDQEPVTFDIYYDSTDTNHIALLTAAKNKTLMNFKEILVDNGAEQYAYSAYVGMKFSGQVEGFNVYSVELSISGDITIS